MLCTARVLSMTSWFSATALTPELRDTWKLSGPFLVWLTNGVQIGFVIGALALSLVNLPDIIRLNRLMAASAAMAAVANASLLFEPGQGGLLLARAMRNFLRLPPNLQTHAMLAQRFRYNLGSVLRSPLEQSG